TTLHGILLEFLLRSLFPNWIYLNTAWSNGFVNLYYISSPNGSLHGGHRNSFVSVSDVGSEKLFSPSTPKGVSTNENPESKTVSSAKVSGLQRSQEQSNEVSFAPPVSSPTPASPPSGSPAPAATAAAPPQPLTKAQLTSPPPLLIKRELDRVPPIPRFPTPPLLRAQPHPLQEHRVPVSLPPPQNQHHARPLISHQVHQHHPLHYNSLHDIRYSRTPSDPFALGLFSNV
uniref:Uncharacterized protein n=1 Tax=Hucho hucho TaxID=62062 RepID=A0A4W5ML64_9TELE